MSMDLKVYTLNEVKAMPLDVVYKHALHDLNDIAKQKIRNHKYCTTPHMRLFYRKRYYLRNDIYHPEYNPDGTIEKRYKRTK